MTAWCTILLFSLCSLLTPAVSTAKGNDTRAALSGFGYEMFAAQLNYLQNKLLEVDSTVQGMSEKIGHNLTTLQEQSGRMLAQQTTCTAQPTVQTTYQSSTPVRSCKEALPRISGRYLIQPFENETAFDGYWEQSRFGGGWLVMQQRYDGLLNFQRGWSEYVNGFGSVVGEFWLGLGRVHRLTSARSHELLVELEDFAGNYVYARCRQFEIGSGKDQYPLKKLEVYSGTASDSLVYHRGMKFTTLDQDNDAKADSNCAIDYSGAWWYKHCHYSNLNLVCT